MKLGYIKIRKEEVERFMKESEGLDITDPKNIKPFVLQGECMSSGSVRKRGKKWYYSIEVAKVGGKRKRIERVGGDTQKEAKAALRKALLEFEETGLTFSPSNISVSDYFDYWFEKDVMLNCRYNTQLAYKNMIENILNLFLEYIL